MPAMLDARAKDAYRRRLAEIEDDIDQARALEDTEREMQADAERDFLLRELLARGRPAAAALPAHRRVYDEPGGLRPARRARGEGKLRYYGVSVQTVDEALRALRHPNLQSVQIIFNMFRLKPAERFFAARAREAGRHPGARPAGERAADRQAAPAADFAADDHRQFNREGQAFDKGETFSGVPYDVGLQAVEELRRLSPRRDARPVRAALDPAVPRGHLRDPRRQDAGAGARERGRRGAPGARAEDDVRGLRHLPGADPSARPR